MLAVNFNIVILIGLYIIGRIPIIEPVHQNLVHNSALGPARRRKSRHNGKSIFRPYLGRHAHPVIIAVEHPGGNLKIILVLLRPQGYFDPVVIKFPTGFLFFHRGTYRPAAQPYNIHIIFGSAEGKGNIFIFVRLRRIPVILCPV